MSYVDYLSDGASKGSHQLAHGSDGRLNVTSRVDERIYYISRDNSEAFTMVFDDANATAADYVAYLKNTNAVGKHMVIHSIGVNCEAASSSFKLSVVTGTQSGGAAVTPTCLNRAAPKAAAATAAAPADSNSTPMTSLVEAFVLDHVGITGAYGHAEFRIQDSIRLAQDEAIAIELESAAAADVRCFGVVFFYFE